MKKWLSILLTASLVFTLLTGCGSKEEAAPEPEKEVQTEEEEEPEEESTEITVTDQAGNTVTLEKPAEKIVTCFYGQSYSMIALGLKDKLAGMEAKANVRPIYSLAAPEFLELPNVGSQKEFNVEAAIALEPDLVLLPKKLQDTASSFEAVGIPVAICYPESQELLEEQLVMIATLCGKPENADKLIEYYHTKFDEMDKITSELSDEEKPSIYMASVSSYMSAAPKDMYQATLIEKAGGVNAAGEIDGDYWTDLSYEQILAMNPDIIVLPSEAEYTADDVKNDAQLAEVTAVKNGAVYAMPKDFEAWDSPVPSGVLGALWMLAAAHGNLYSMDQMRTDAAEFYSEFYGFEADTSVIN